MPSFDEELQQIRDAGLWRSVRVLDSKPSIQVLCEGQTLWNFAANDYLGLAENEQLADAMIEGVRRFGHGAAASRLICGTTVSHAQLEAELAAAKKTSAALLYGSGFSVALGVIPVLLGRSDHVILDKLSHACLIDAAKSSGAQLRVFAHNDMEQLEQRLQQIRAKDATGRILIVTESVFSMDGDVCPLDRLVALKQRFDAMLLLDEAHAFGIMGPTGMGLAEQWGLQEAVDLQMGTLSKAAGLAGGFVACSQAVRDLLVNRSRTWIYSTAPPPALAHAARHALMMIRSEWGNKQRLNLHKNVQQVCDFFGETVAQAALVPVMVRHNERAVQLSQQLREMGLIVPAIRYPTVPRHLARLRVSISAAHTAEALAALQHAFGQVMDFPRLSG